MKGAVQLLDWTQLNRFSEIHFIMEDLTNLTDLFSKHPPIGIDWGTTVSVVAMFRENHVDILKPPGSATTETPSVVRLFQNRQVIVRAATLTPSSVPSYLFRYQKHLGRDKM